MQVSGLTFNKEFCDYYIIGMTLPKLKWIVWSIN